MFPSSKHTNGTQPLNKGNDKRSTRPLTNPNEIFMGNIPTGPVWGGQPSNVTSGPLWGGPPSNIASGPVLTPPTTPAIKPVTSTKLPVYIPATEKRRKSHTTGDASHHRRPRVFFGVLISCITIFTLTFFFVDPLDHGQQSQSIAQSVGNWIFSGPLGVISPVQHIATPTPTPALLTGEGYCGGKDIWGTCATAITASGVMGTGTMEHPLDGAIITQPFGVPEYQQWCGCWRPHTGIDLAAPEGTPVLAADDGQVIWTGWEWSGLGWAVKINHGHFIATIYGHLQRFIVQVGQNVTKGQIIAYEGSTGASTGPHVHFMVMDNNRWKDPTLYIKLP